jgi:hypothetical protein
VGIIDSIKSPFDIKLQETYYSPIVLGYIYSINYEFEDKVSRLFRAVTYLCFREESLGLCYSSNMLADHYLKDLS